MAVTEAKPKRPRRERTENAAMRRRQLVEATIEAVVRNGLAATTLATVAEEAGLSQGVAVFYFKTKQGLLTETLRYHYEEYDAIWRKALNESGDDPVERLIALVFADLDDRICTARNLALWAAFWGETTARPAFAEICDLHDSARTRELLKACEAVSEVIAGSDWTPDMLAETLDGMTDGFWTRMHISPNSLDNTRAREIIANFLVTVLPSRRDQIFELAKRASTKKRRGARKAG